MPEANGTPALVDETVRRVSWRGRRRRPAGLRLGPELGEPLALQRRARRRWRERRLAGHRSRRSSQRPSPGRIRTPQSPGGCRSSYGSRGTSWITTSSSAAPRSATSATRSASSSSWQGAWVATRAWSAARDAFATGAARAPVTSSPRPGPPLTGQWPTLTCLREALRARAGLPLPPAALPPALGGRGDLQPILPATQARSVTFVPPRQPARRRVPPRVRRALRQGAWPAAARRRARTARLHPLRHPKPRLRACALRHVPDQLCGAVFLSHAKLLPIV